MFVHRGMFIIHTGMRNFFIFLSLKAPAGCFFIVLFHLYMVGVRSRGGGGGGGGGCGGGGGGGVLSTVLGPEHAFFFVSDLPFGFRLLSSRAAQSLRAQNMTLEKWHSDTQL